MAEVNVIIEGFCLSEVENGLWSSVLSTVTLVKDAERNVLIDCGGPWDGDRVVEALKNVSMKCEDISDVVITHGHSDHCGNLSLFQRANIYMDRDHACPSSRYTELKDAFPITANIIVLRTPGHTDNDLTVQVTTKQGVVVVAGDIFENESDSDKWLASSRYPGLQRKSRENILKTADWIVPGHGRMFQNPRRK